MNHKKILFLVAFGLVLAISSAAFANTVDSDAGEGLGKLADGLKNFVFGKPMKISALLGGAFAGMQGLLGNHQRMITFGGGALGAILIPAFIDGVFQISGMLLP